MSELVLGHDDALRSVRAGVTAIDRDSNAAHRMLLRTISASLPASAGSLDAEGAQRVADLVRAEVQRLGASPVADALGPVYDAAGVQTLTGWSRQDLSQRRQRGTVLGVQLDDGRWVYPVFQFGRDGVAPQMGQVLRRLRLATGDIPPMTAAIWFRTPTDSLEGQSPAHWLLSERDAGAVLAMAADMVRRFAA